MEELTLRICPSKAGWRGRDMGKKRGYFLGSGIRVKEHVYLSRRVEKKELFPLS